MWLAVTLHNSDDFVQIENKKIKVQSNVFKAFMFCGILKESMKEKYLNFGWTFDPVHSTHFLSITLVSTCGQTDINMKYEIKNSRYYLQTNPIHFVH